MAVCIVAHQSPEAPPEFGQKHRRAGTAGLGISPIHCNDDAW